MSNAMRIQGSMILAAWITRTGIANQYMPEADKVGGNLPVLFGATTDQIHRTCFGGKTQKVSTVPEPGSSDFTKQDVLRDIYCNLLLPDGITEARMFQAMEIATSTNLKLMVSRRNYFQALNTVLIQHRNMLPKRCNNQTKTMMNAMSSFVKANRADGADAWRQYSQHLIDRLYDSVVTYNVA